MDNLDDLRLRIERVISELEEITQLLTLDISDSKKAVSHPQIKEIEASIERLKRQNQPVPEELTKLKLRLLSSLENQQELISLNKKLKDNIRNLIFTGKQNEPPKEIIGDTKVPLSPYRKPPNYEKPLGSKGNSNLEDYLIPVIKLMWSGHDHNDAFRQIAKKLDVRYNTVSSQCTRSLSLTTDEFINRVASKRIVDLIENKFPEQYQMIKTHLKK